MTHLATTTTRGSLARPDSTVGFRTYYVYDGNDVAFTLVRPSTGTTWRIQQRYVNTGLDENVAARLWLNGTPTSLALVTDRQGGYIMGVRNNGTEETSTGFYLRNAFGKMESGSTAASSLETHTGLGFAGAGTPTSAGGGYVYLRNRWYDPQTGRFLSQDPIGLAGGVNLYAYAGNNPVAYSDPFGLCPPEWMCQLIASFVANHPKAAAAASTLIDQEVAGFACGSQAFQNCQVPPSGTAGALAGQLMLALSVRAPVGGAAGGVGGAALADESVVVRGGTGDVPPPGTTFSGAAGTTLEDAASGVPHGTIRATTAGRIRQAGGTVESAPELTRGGTLNEKHVNICLGGGPCPFGDPMPNPVPKSGRVK